MKVEIRLIDSPQNENGRLLEIVEGRFKDHHSACEVVVAAMLRNAVEKFGADNIEIVHNKTIFGGHYRHKQTRDCIIAV